MVAENEARFVENNFEKDRTVVRQSFLRWHPIDGISKSDVLRMILRGKSYVDDNRLLTIGDLTLKQDDIFQFEPQDTRAIPYSNGWYISVTYELSLDQIIYKRDLYNLLDFMRDLGGLAVAFRAICVVLVHIF